jgi:uncharacterized protein
MSRAPRQGVLLLLLALVWLTGCGGHAARTREARTALDTGSPSRALTQLNTELDVDGAEQLPEDLGGDNALLLLDRAMVLQYLASLGRDGWRRHSRLSSRDLEAADKEIEILDLSRNAVGDIGRYLFSDASGPYKAPTYEKLMINTMNMVNYLARGDLNGGRVEARRLAVMQKFIREHEDIGAALAGPGSYLAGFIFEKSERPQEALRYYDEALQHGRFRSLDAAIVRLARQASYRSPRLRKVLEEAGVDPATGAPRAEAPAAPESDDAGTSGDREGAATTTAAEAPPHDEGATPPTSPGRPAEVLVIISFGRVPAKIAKRVPIGLALTWASGALSPTDRARANYLAGQGLVTWVNYPELDRPRGTYDTPGFALDGSWQPLEEALAVDRQVRQEWDRAKGAVVASAITRMITRVVAGETTRRAAGGGIFGALLSLGTQAALTAADTPDTRSWSTLPARIAVGRVELPPGTHWVDVAARGVRKRQKVTLPPGGWSVVHLTVLG